MIPETAEKPTSVAEGQPIYSTCKPEVYEVHDYGTILKIYTISLPKIDGKFVNINTCYCMILFFSNG